MTLGSPQSGPSLKRRRNILLASAVALGLSGLIGGEALIVGMQPAAAQTTTAQPPAPQAQMMSFADMVARAKPAVVSVRVRMEDQSSPQQLTQGIPFFFRDLPEDSPLRRFFGDQYGNGNGDNGSSQRDAPHHFAMAQGSGFFISPDGYLVTNNHVVEHATKVDISTDNGKTYSAKVVGTDPRTDLALLKVDSNDTFKYVKFAKGMPRVGDWVVAVGNPFGLGGTVTAGIVSARGRDIGSGPYDDYLQIDASVNRGNSGGPTFNLNGDVVGVNTAIYSPSGGNVGIAFAVPSEVATNVIAQLKDHGSVTRGWLGVQIQPVTKDIAESVGLKDDKGAMVVEPQSGTPAAKAGVRAGDIITAVNGDSITDAHDLSRKIAGMEPGATADLTIWRNGESRRIAVDLGKLPADQKLSQNDRGGREHGSSSSSSTPTALADLGLQLRPADQVDGSGKDGVVVTQVDQDKPVAQDLRKGDVILEAAGNKVSAPGQIADAMKSAHERGTHSVLLRVRSGDVVHYVAIPSTAKG
jgi:serine protease Do